MTTLQQCRAKGEALSSGERRPGTGEGGLTRDPCLGFGAARVRRRSEEAAGERGLSGVEASGPVSWGEACAGAGWEEGCKAPALACLFGGRPGISADAGRASAPLGFLPLSRRLTQPRT